MTAHYHGILRMDWGLGNPNKTAAVVAMLLVTVWVFCSLVKKGGFWLSLILFIILGICLVDTASRGGLLAAVLGLSILIWWGPKPWKRIHIFAIIAGSSIILLNSICLKTFSRYEEGITQEDPSITNRLVLWTTLPRMIVDSPCGWGLGNSGRAYMEWYQPLDRAERYRTMVNSHFTWLAEVGWLSRGAYIAAWIYILALCYPHRNESFGIIPFSVWAVFGTAAFFSSIAESLWTWVLPVLSLSIVLGFRVRLSSWLPRRFYLWNLLATCSSLALIFIAGNLLNPHIIAGAPGMVTINGTPQTWILVDSHVLGEDYGRTLRGELYSQSVGFIDTKTQFDSIAGKRLIICGNQPMDRLTTNPSLYSNFLQIIFVNPTFFPGDAKLGSARVRATVIFGEFSRSPAKRAWQELFGRNVSIISGAGDFLQKWPTYLLPKN